jgi:hypothetical protein
MALIMDVEERFGVAIPDEKAERIGTVGELYVFLLEQARRHAPIRCPSSRAFYQLRRILTGELGVDRAQVRPSVLLRDLLPAPSRGVLLPRLAAALDLADLPDPDPPWQGPTSRGLGKALALATAGIWRINLLLLWLLGVPVAVGLLKVWFLLWGLVVAGVLTLFGTLWLEEHRRRRLPKVRDLVLRLAARDWDRYLAEDAADPTPAAVWSDLVQVLSAHTRVPPAEILPEQRFDELR